jgi:Exo-beta-D-glucosaminidase Ig-fold domain/Concanavalin A-like lectin/glucanases superfamily/Glycosyl hydrolases family 2/Glycosyl hydrolases family 2, sugar binding domain/Glycosyl hydrolases family 2, TIM barrel domain
MALRNRVWRLLMTDLISPARRAARLLVIALFAFTAFAGAASAQFIATNDPAAYGPYNATFLADGEGLHKPLVQNDSVLRADSPWTLYFWIEPDAEVKAPTLFAGVGSPTEEFPRYLAAGEDGRLMLWNGKNNALQGTAAMTPKQWNFVAATFDGTTFRLYSKGVSVGEGKLDLGSVSPMLYIAPPQSPLEDGTHFGGKIASLTLLRRALTPDELRQLSNAPPDFALVEFEEGSKPWPVQTRAQAGYPAPQDPSAMPTSRAPLPPGVAATALPRSSQQPALEESSANHWIVAGGWMLAAAPDVKADAAEISQPGFNTKDTKAWMPATVPGTVLTTMIDRGIYPDPDYGLNNLAIPESLNKQDYWYRTEFKPPSLAAGQQLTLTFEGINYAADIYLNGQALGRVKGAFIRGVFDVTHAIKPGQSNVLAVRISPPPHPGIPQEQSIKGGPGENGGIMCLDGPTFVATEGWDWIPAIRDRDTGIWQPVTLNASGGVKIGDPQVVTTLPLPDTSRADVDISVPLDNATSAPISGTLTATFEQVSITKTVTAAPGKSTVKLTPAEFAQLRIQNPRLWWPNGYGKQDLYHLKLSFRQGEGRDKSAPESDTKQIRFGIREITYELSLLDSTGHLRRVEYSPTVAHEKSESVVDVSHNGMREIPAADPFPSNFPESWREGWHSWVASLTPAAESSTSIHTLDDKRAAPYLVIRVNGVRIAARGGNWGMDDSRKRVSRARLEPYFILHRQANLNIIRNWVGQDTEEVFFDLADEYGLLVWNDFWASTQNYNVEPEDPALFLDNARDTILRFRNHPSIVMWCGRNEGVPQPILNQGLAELTASLDGTRYYSPSSNQVNLQNSGPYKYQPPSSYFTTLNHGFSVETGTQSLSTLESLRASIPQADQWPIDDVWAYHDWHASGNGEITPFMNELQSEFGAATSLDDFERKAQMLNYVEHRAIFEGMNAHLWAPNSGRMLWMTQPAWPSNMWQILSSDYDTQASFYAVKKASEPVHVQLDPSNNTVAVINNTTQPLPGVTVTAAVYQLDGKTSVKRAESKIDAKPSAETDAIHLDLAPHLAANGVLFVKLQLHAADNSLLSENFYWLAADSPAYRALNRIPTASVTATATSAHANSSTRVRVRLQNSTAAPALNTKLTLLNAGGARILPAYYADNYISLLPDESREIEIEYPDSASATASRAQIAIRGWNVAPVTAAVSK